MRSIFLLLAAALTANAADWPQWRGPLRNGVVPDSPKLLVALPEEGLKELWESEQIPSNDEGGLSSPVVAGGRVVMGLVWHRDIPSETRQVGELVLRQLGHQSVKSLGDALVAYRITPENAERMWSRPIDALRTQSSPILHDGHVFLTDDNNHYCFKAATGEVAWKTQAQTTISSPVIADGKLFTMANNGNSLLMIAAEPRTYISLGRATVKAQWIPSPCIANGRLILRMKDSVKAWSLVK